MFLLKDRKNVYIRPTIEKILAHSQIFPWAWDLDKAQHQLEQVGYRVSDEDADERIFTGMNKAIARIRLEQGSMQWLEFVLAAVPDPHILDEAAYAEKQRTYETLFHNAVNRIEVFLGPPLFVGAAGEVGFPLDQWAEWAAVWHSKNGRIMTQIKQNDTDLPLELCLVFAPM